MSFSIAERRDMIIVYCECRQNSVQAQLLHARKYPDRRCPSAQTIVNIFKLFKDTGSIEKKKRVRNKLVTNVNNEINVLAAIAVDPHTSTRNISREASISQSSVIRILHRHRFHPFHLSLHQELHGTDFQNRINFCEWGLRQNPEFFNNVLFTDEATFTSYGAVNLRNAHYWSVDNPHWLREVEHQRQWSINVWCGIVNNKIIGPYFINRTLTGGIYAQFLREILPGLLEDIPLQNRLNMWYQHDGCPAHYARVSRDVLNRNFPGHWIGRGGTVQWPARSPDLNPLDFFLWGTIKNIVYANRSTTAEDMRHRIVVACENITGDTLNNVSFSVTTRLQKCFDVNGHHFEHILK